MLRLITDFDGPIMDVSERYYRVYQLCLEKTRYPQQTITELSKAEFWQLKRSHTPELQIALQSGLDAQQGQEFSQIRKQIVHTLPYFQYDVLVPTALETLTKVQAAGVDLAVMTMRRVRELDYAFNQYNLSQFFPENRRYCLSNDYVKTRDVEDKPLLMARALAELPPAADTWMVGDTEADITAAKKHDIKIIAVESGIRDRSQLASYQPDMIVTDLKTAVDFILKQ
ncbi:MAG: HAD family hydrolase [Dolichospermum sp. JUN01]|jgi:phosphoglycolate phosphatase-like HAD superfamily hydrolase|uniref:HAD family hydrolase n=1 Tax=Dolichospermum lemmermannii TaxID=54295 RepID=UPI001A2B1DFE|nr:HAD family hydrolase [Dolichospermum lemmermannii]MBJ7294785.1 HAD family hydrolase [Dolichospermum sp.]MBO1047336.1 HAD family hydrolase [Dolichospermum sp. DEX182a]MBO1055345.1 HAD family hydrolase [Dolichospermum sp. JUN01]MDB9436960.1 HAD family hydrolase [Dolichospermum lemmermannii CS-548]